MAVNLIHLPRILERHGEALLADWIREQLQSRSRTGAIKEGELREQCAEFLRLFREATTKGGVDMTRPEYGPLRELLANVSASRGAQGFSPSETAKFVFSFKRPLFMRLREELMRDPVALADETWAATELLDELGLYTTEVYQKAREAVIVRQQEEMLELSTPVVKLWDGILALPMIGTLDSNRTQVVMETLLEKIVETGSEVAIIDITGVPTVDTLVAQHLMKTVAAARLMGAECIISGIRPAIAQTIVHLAIDLGTVVTKANLADAFKAALDKLGVAQLPGR
ncbi:MULTISPECIES: STAS domain-containing protein [Anaeromyxobacter]|uniref:STAS domain-containing protein n=1 Tax=Anaeromyxobacter TaxID=161492 RepID=UPI001F5AD5B3|nr:MULTISPECIES: STAS domain-containing protein [unclassified Anaeromyxobacter]